MGGLGAGAAGAGGAPLGTAGDSATKTKSGTSQRMGGEDMGMGQNPGTPGEPQNSWDLWMFIPLKMYL
jgi:hypothetical protein